MQSISDSPSDNSSDDARRTCPKCGLRMSSLLHDKHSCCYICRGQECTADNKCMECNEWEEAEFQRYAKHRKALESKSKARKSKSKSEDKASSGVTNRSASGVENVNTQSGMSEEQVRKLIADQFSLLTESCCINGREFC